MRLLSDGRGRARCTYFVVALFLIVVTAIYSHVPPWTRYADVWEQAAAMRAVCADLHDPTNPMLALPGDTSPRLTPYTLFWGMVLRVTRLDIARLLVIVAVFNLSLLTSGLWRFVRSQYRDERLGLVLLITMLVLWGTGYGQSNDYHLQAFIYTAPYLATFAFGLMFHALAALRVYLEHRSVQALIVYGTLALLAFLSHPITAVLLFVAAYALLIAERKLFARPWVHAVPILTLCVALLWPYFDHWQLLTDGSAKRWYDTGSVPSIWKALGPAWLGVPLAGFFAFRRRHHFPVIGLGLSSGLYLYCGWIGILIGGRLIFLMAFFLQLLVALWLIELWNGRAPGWKRLRLTNVALLRVLLLAAGWAMRHRQTDMRRVSSRIVHSLGVNFSKLDSDAHRLAFLKDYIGVTDVLMAPANDGLIIPAITGAKVVAHIHGNPLITDELDLRCKDVAQFFGSRLTLDERDRLLRKYAVTTILIDSSADENIHPDLQNGLAHFALPVAIGTGQVLFRVPPPLSRPLAENDVRLPKSALMMPAF